MKIQLKNKTFEFTFNNFKLWHKLGELREIKIKDIEREEELKNNPESLLIRKFGFDTTDTVNFYNRIVERNKFARELHKAGAYKDFRDPDVLLSLKPVYFSFDKIDTIENIEKVLTILWFQFKVRTSTGNEPDKNGKLYQILQKSYSTKTAFNSDMPTNK